MSLYQMCYSVCNSSHVNESCVTVTLYVAVTRDCIILFYVAVGGNSSNRAELGAACLALEDVKRKQDRKPIILLSDSACFVSSSQKWIGEGKSPSMHGNPDADIMRDIVQLLRIKN